MDAWYALYTKPYAEARVARTLMARGFTVFLPLLPARPGKRSEPLFPAYLFVSCDLDVLGVASLQAIPGLRRIVGFGGQPFAMPGAAIDLIRGELAAIEAQGGLPSHPFKPGDQVVIDSGPLADLRGIFLGPVGPAERVVILIRFLGNANRAEVPVSALRAAPEQQRALPRRCRTSRGRGRRIHGPTADDRTPQIS